MFLFSLLPYFLNAAATVNAATAAPKPPPPPPPCTCQVLGFKSW